MGTLIRFELKKILGNRAGMVACALMFAMLVAIAAMDLVTTRERDHQTGELLSGLEAQAAYRAMQESHAGILDDEQAAADAAIYDHADELAKATPDFESLSNQQIIDRYGLAFWLETSCVLGQRYYTEIVGTLDSATPRATSLREGAQERVEGILSEGFRGYFPYSAAEKTYWRQLESGITWPMTYGYDGGWHYVLTWRGSIGLAIVALCVALSGLFAGEYQTRAAAIVLPTKHGKRGLPIAKVIAAFLFTTAYWCVITACVVVLQLAIYGTEGWSLPVQVALGFDNPYPLTIGQAVLRSYALGYLIALGMAALTLLLSAKMHSTMPVAAITMAFQFLGIIALFSAPLAKVALLTPFSGLSYVFDSMVSFAAGPVVIGLPAMLALVYGFMLVVFTPLATRLFKRHQVA